MSDSIRLGEGARLGRYQIVRRLGAGAMGEVYLADDPQIGRRLALKTVRVEEGRVQEVEERKRRLLREARAAGKLLHPNIVTLFDVGEEQGMLYLAFEFVQGTDLAVRVSEGQPLLLAEALAIVRQAAEALDYAHRQGVIHRDIKPSNLMLTAEGKVKVADFGIAKILDQTSDLTMTGSVVGSPHYLSPEQIRGDELDGRTDVFSLGVLFYEILCRKKPFEADTLTTLVYRILNQEPTPIIVRRPDLEPRLVRLVQKMLAKDRDQRFASAAEVAAEIAICEQELSPTLLARQARPAEAPNDGTVRLPPEAPEPPPSALLPAPAIAVPDPVAPPAPPSFLPPPPPSMVLPPPPPAPLARVATDSTAFSPPAASSSRLIWIALAAIALLALLIVGGLGARRWAASRAPAEPVASSATKSPSGAVENKRVATVPPIAADPEPEPNAQRESASEKQAAQTEAPEIATVEPSVAPAFQPGERPRPVQRPAETSPSGSGPSTSSATPPVRRTAPAPPAETYVAPVLPAAEAPVESAPAEDPRAAREALIARLPVAREMNCGMSLSFDVQPKELAERLVVRFDRIVIGRAADWNAKKRDGRAYAIAEPGLHILTFLLDGADVHRIRIDARPQTSSPTTIVINLPQFGKHGKRPGGGS